MAKGDAREVGHTISDSSQYLTCIMFIYLFSASIKVLKRQNVCRSDRLAGVTRRAAEDACAARLESVFGSAV